MSDILDQANDFLDGGSLVNNYVANTDNKEAAKLLLDAEDSEKEEPIVLELPQMPIESQPRKAPDYEALRKRLRAGEELYAVKNTSDVQVILDWDIPLMPADLHQEFDKYLTQKYVQYGLGRAMNQAKMVAVLIEGRTVNFLESFMNEKQIPTLVPMQIGREVVVKSQFVITPGEEIIVTAKQLESLAKYEKIKREFETEKGSTTSDWLGFLIFKPLNEGDDVEKYNRSYVTSADAMKSGIVIDTNQVRKRNERKVAGVIRATE